MLRRVVMVCFILLSLSLSLLGFILEGWSGRRGGEGTEGGGRVRGRQGEYADEVSSYQERVGE